MSTPKLQNEEDVRDDDLTVDWFVVPGAAECWKTPFLSVPWNYHLSRQWSDSGERLPHHPRPPFHHDILFTPKRNQVGLYPGDNEKTQEEDVALNPQLPGVLGVEEALSVYEYFTGINDRKAPTVEELWKACIPRPMYKGELDDADHGAIQKVWDGHVHSVLGETLGHLPRNDFLPLPNPHEVPQWDLDSIDEHILQDILARTPPPRVAATPSIVDLTDSDMSLQSESLPSTPQVDKKSYAEILFDHPGHQPASPVIAPSPSKPLNAAAMAFVPSFLQPPQPKPQQSPIPLQPELPPAYTTSDPNYEYHFPSLSSQLQSPPRSYTRSLPPNLERDEQGFYRNQSGSPTPAPSHSTTRSVTPKRVSASLLPAFLANASTTVRNRHTSKTREIVDRLRSGETNGGHITSKEESALRVSVGSAEDLQSLKRNGCETHQFSEEGWITGLDVNVEQVFKAKRTSAWAGGSTASVSILKRQGTHERKVSRNNSRTPSRAGNAVTTPNSIPATLPVHSPASSTRSAGPHTPSSTFSVASGGESPAHSYYSCYKYPTNYGYPVSPTLQSTPHSSSGYYMMSQWGHSPASVHAGSNPTYQHPQIAYAMPQKS